MRRGMRIGTRSACRCMWSLPIIRAAFNASSKPHVQAILQHCAPKHPTNNPPSTQAAQSAHSLLWCETHDGLDQPLAKCTTRFVSGGPPHAQLVSRCKITTCTQLLRHCCEKRGVQICFFISRAVKWACRARCPPQGLWPHHNTIPTRRHCGEVQLLAKNLGPDMFSCSQNGGCELTRAFAFGTHLTRLHLLGLLCATQKRRHINTCEISSGQNDQHNQCHTPQN